MDDQKIDRIKMLLESISKYWSIYDPGVRSNLIELEDRIFDLKLDLHATLSVLPVIQQEIEAQDGVALEQFGAGPSCAIPSLPSNSDDTKNQIIPRVQDLMETLTEPMALEQLNEVLLDLKSIPPLIYDFRNKRHAMIIRMLRYDQQTERNGHLLVMSPLEAQQQKKRVVEYLTRNPQLKTFITSERHFHKAWTTWLSGLDLTDAGSSPANVEALSADNSASRMMCIEIKSPNSKCSSANYQLASSNKINMLEAHIKNCTKGKSGACLACKRLRFLYAHHAALCQDEKCSVPFCFNIKRKLNQLPQLKQGLCIFLLRFIISDDIIKCRGNYC